MPSQHIAAADVVVYRTLDAAACSVVVRWLAECIKRMLLAENFLFSPQPITAVQDFFGRGHAMWFDAFSLLGDTWGVLLAIGLALWLWGRDIAYALFFVVIVSALLKEGMNLLVTVPRPTEPAVVVYQHLETPSFPSGHVLTAVAMWTLLYLRERIHLAVLLAVVILVCLGRIYLGAHYLVDVVVGAAAGIAAAWAVATTWTHVRGWVERLSFRWVSAAGAVAALAASVNLFLNSGIQHRWAVTGLAVGLIGGLLLEYRVGGADSSERNRSTGRPPDGSRSAGPSVRSSDDLSADASHTRIAGRVAAGTAGLAVAYALTTLSLVHPMLIDMSASIGAAFWTTFAVPLLIRRRRNVD